MAQRNEKVYDRVRQELAKNPNLGSKELYEVAQGVDKTIAQDSLQQFHARYVLPVKREKSGGQQKQRKRSESRARKPAQRARRATAAVPAANASPSTGASATAEGRTAGQDTAAATPRTRGRRPRLLGGRQTSGAANRDQVRALLLQFAQELTDAESRSSLVKVLGKVDSYVDRIAPAQS